MEEVLFEDFLDTLTDDDSQKGRASEDVVDDVFSDDSIETLRDNYDVVVMYRFYIGENTAKKIMDDNSFVTEPMTDVLDTARCISDYRFGRPYIYGTRPDSPMIPVTADTRVTDTVYYAIPIGMNINFSVVSVLKTFAQLYDATTMGTRNYASQNLIIIADGQENVQVPPDHVRNLYRKDFSFDSRDHFFEGVSFRDVLRLLMATNRNAFSQQDILDALRRRYPEYYQHWISNQWKGIAEGAMLNMGIPRTDTKKVNPGMNIMKVICGQQLNSENFSKTKNTEFYFSKIMYYDNCYRPEDDNSGKFKAIFDKMDNEHVFVEDCHMRCIKHHDIVVFVSYIGTITDNKGMLWQCFVRTTGNFEDSFSAHKFTEELNTIFGGLLDEKRIINMTFKTLGR